MRGGRKLKNQAVEQTSTIKVQQGEVDGSLVAAARPVPSTMNDVSRLVHVILNSTDNSVKRQSECDLNSLLLQSSFWADPTNVDALMLCDDTVLFFLCKGMQKFLWKSWSMTDSAQLEIQHRLQSQVMNILYSKSLTLQLFARSKVEQLLSTISILSLSLDSITTVITAITSSGSSDSYDKVKVCLSILRTCCEDILNTNSKIPPEKAKVLNKIIEDLAPQLVTFTTSSMVTGDATGSVQVTIDQIVKDEQLLLLALELLKVIIAKVRVGPHLSNHLLNLLFAIAENTAMYSNSRTTSNSPSPSIVAVEALSELMAKNYLPNSDNILTEILIKAIVLFKHVIHSGSSSRSSSSSGSGSSKSILDSLAITGPLLEFILLFCENHLNRCLRANNSSIRQQIPNFLLEITTITLSIYDINLVLKTVRIWESILSIESTMDYVTGSLGSSISIPVLNYLLMTCLVLRNDNLQEYIDDLEDSLAIEPIADVHIREIVEHLKQNNSGGGGDNLSVKGGGAVRGAEEASDSISGIRAGYLTLLGLFYSHGCSSTGQNDVHSWLVATVPPIMQVLVDKVSNASATDDDAYAAAIDMAFVIRVLPLCCDKADLFIQFSSLTLHFMNHRVYTKGKMYTNIIVSSNEVIIQALGAYRRVLYKDSHWDGVYEYGDPHSSDPEYVAAKAIVEKTFHLLQLSFQILALATDVSVSPPPAAVMATTSSLVLSTLSVLGCRSKLVSSSLTDYLQLFYQRLQMLPLEIQAILVCIADHLVPGEVSVRLSQQIREIIATTSSDGRSVVYNIGVQGSSGSSALSNPSTIALLCRSCGCLDALSKFHSTSPPAERQALVNNLLLLKDSIRPLAEHVFASLHTIVNVQPAMGSTPMKGALLTAAKLLLSLSCSLVQSLGKRSFGAQAVDVLLICVQYLTNDDLGLKLISDGSSGLLLIKEVLQLVNIIAQSSSSATADAEVRMSASLYVLNIASKALSDSYICSELLNDVLRTGIIITNSYWPGRGSAGSSAADDITPPPTLAQTVELVVGLCVGSLDPSIPPQEALVALEGLLSLGTEHNLYGAYWFQQTDSYNKLVSALVRCIVFRQHATYAEETMSVLSVITKSSEGVSGDLWDFVGGVIASVAAERGCAETAKDLLAALASRGVRGIDMSHFSEFVLIPLAMQVEVHDW